ncbi:MULTISPECIES: M24 family metallopeptidase [Sinorhizobium]|uniref:Hydrolase n=1 Tax=Sinorhizobium americanum TaxID=194963 RepID=A0A2S3YNH2_9HYPH|nr:MULTISPECIES: Xaa-Pro peptidase family protein [Sinorhizobium]PDT33402.1 hydrolase [Sinorhizobium sp. FG01]PDT47997.1 hydrolase [Sinorhizobium sp. NG07B]POH29889.1 hydrolase [Sinorhizobium americanum]POH30607.1 hydrolase [Sinorhizobium americanum]
MPICKGPQAFPRAEFLRRLSAAKSEMARRGVEALIVFNTHNITYLTGYTTPSGYVPEGIIVLLHEEEPIFILRQMDAPAAIHQTFMSRDRIVAYPETLIGTPEKNGYDAIIDFMYEKGLEAGGIGLELGELRFHAVTKFRSRFSDARIEDCTHLVTWIRIIKSDLEIAIMREAAAITDAAMQRAAEVIRIGVREADAVAEIAAALARGANGKPGTYIPEITLVSSPRTGTAHIRWSEDLFRKESQINIEIAGVRHGYTVPLMRTFSIGEPSERLQRVHDAHLAGLEAALETIRPGRSCSDVSAAFHRIYKKHGLKKESRCGYANGIGWIEPTASFQKGDMTELKPNMTFHLMLGNWFDEDFGYMFSESIRVTESGVEVLTNTPRRVVTISDA